MHTEKEEYLLETFESSAVAAEEAGMTVIRSTGKTLLLDLDTGAQLDQYGRVLGFAERAFPGLRETERWCSKSKRGIHVIVELPIDLSAAERLALQAALGSDPVRELLGIALLRSGIENPVMLFRPAAM